METRVDVLVGVFVRRISPPVMAVNLFVGAVNLPPQAPWWLKVGSSVEAAGSPEVGILSEVGTQSMTFMWVLSGNSVWRIFQNFGETFGKYY